jgi:hypothetical protein
MKRKLILAATTLLLFAACGKSQIDPSGVMGNVAKAYYDYLIEGKYDAYVDGFYQPDSIPGSYREQLITNAKMFTGLMNEQHKGLKSVSIASAKADTAHHVGHAFLIMHFGDGTKEEVVVPMVERQGNWMLR